MARLNKLDCEYTLEEAKNVDVNDITTHPFFKKHFSKARKEFQGITTSSIPDNHDLYHFQTEHDYNSLKHYKPKRDGGNHRVSIYSTSKIGTKFNGAFKGSGEGTNSHEALNNAIKDYKSNTNHVKPLTESLVGKKPATASKLFAEEMEARLDEISKKTLGRYIERAVADRDRHIEDATQARASADALSNVRADGDAASQTKRSLRSFLGDQERAAHNKKYKREYGVLNALNRLTKEDLDEVEAPANFWNAGMAKMNPIQVSQKQPAEPGQFKATLSKSPTRLADRGSALEGEPRAVRDETADVATSRGPKTIELTGDWHADVPDHEFDPKLDSETEFYPLFSQFKAMGAYPSGPARAWEETEIKEDELNEISKKTLASYVKKASRQASDNDFQAGRHAILGALHGNDYSDHDKHKRISTKRQKGIEKATDKLAEDSLNEISKKTLSKYVDVAADKLAGHAYLAGGGSGLDKEGKTKEFRKAVNRLKGIKLANKKLSEDSASLMATATKDEKKAAEQDKKKPSEFKKLHDKHETEVKGEMKELGEEALDEISKTKSPLKKFKVYTPKYDTHVVVSAKNKKEAHTQAMSRHGSAYEGPNVKITHVPDETLEEGLFDPAKKPLLALWDEHARRADAHGSGSRNEILKRIEDHVSKKYGQEGLKKMHLHSDLTNTLKHSLSPDKGHLQALLGNMRAKCAQGV